MTINLPKILGDNMNMWKYIDGVPTPIKGATKEIIEAVNNYAKKEAEAEKPEKGDKPTTLYR